MYKSNTVRLWFYHIFFYQEKLESSFTYNKVIRNLAKKFKENNPNLGKIYFLIFELQ